MKRMTREWIRNAESDFQLATLIARGSKRFDDELCFHCQQSAEKYLKALLEALNLAIPKTHDLEDLLDLLLPHHPLLSRQRRGLRFLTGFTVDPRYPLMRTTKRQAGAAYRWAGKVRETCRVNLGMHPPRRRRKKT